MAFNFNWSPLSTDADFDRRARDLLTRALNKSPKPPIIVDDILVTEFNLGSVPPDLEILEVGDLAEDRFRGIFKMCYAGDAFLTLKTRVQANPLNTYLGSKPSFTSPQPLAAASGLTIPLQISLSEIKLSALIILVFSRQKGLTLVFRNNPLESLKVSSTFDSIQFVRDYLQRTIEQKLRDLMQDELPNIIHRLSLQLWCPDQIPKEADEPNEESEPAVNPLATPPVDAVDARGHLLDPAEISSLSLDGGPEVQSLFSQHNLIRLAVLANANRSLWLYTPSIRYCIFRAWTGSPERVDSGLAGTPRWSAPSAPSLVKSHSYHGSTTYSFSDVGSVSQGQLPSRPSLVSLHSAATGLSLGPGRHAKPGRRRKNRVVNLRPKAAPDATETAEVASDFHDDHSSQDSGSMAGPASTSSSQALSMEIVPEEQQQEAGLEMPPSLHGTTSSAKVRFRPRLNPDTVQDPLDQMASSLPSAASLQTPAATAAVTPSASSRPLDEKNKQGRDRLPQFAFPFTANGGRPAGGGQQNNARAAGLATRPPPAQSDTSSVILEQAWIMKMAGEIARRVYDEKSRNPGFWEGPDPQCPPRGPPPAYEETN